MNWNHRVVSRGGDFFIIEAYYDDDTITSWHENVRPYGESLDELRADLANIASALDLPVLTDADLPAEPEEAEDLDPWEADPNKLTDWKYEVANDDTRLGFHEWVTHQGEASA